MKSLFLSCLLGGLVAVGPTKLTAIVEADDESGVRGPGLVNLPARATDLAGRTQPECAEWNRLGYGNNAIQQVPIRVV